MIKIKTKARSFLREVALNMLSIGAKPSLGVHLMNSHLLTMKEKLNSDFFDHQLKNLSKKSTIIPFGEAVELIKSHKTIKHSLVAFSFDDGFAECYSHIAPVLEKYNGYACFFINPNFINGDDKYVSSFLKEKVHMPPHKKPMNWLQINELNHSGHIIGAHTMDHVRLTDIHDTDELHYQIGACKGVIDNHTMDDCDYFAFTYGHKDRDFDISSVKIAKNYYNNIFSASNPETYFSYEGSVLNRRHCEPYWKASHINYFLSKKIVY